MTRTVCREPDLPFFRVEKFFEIGEDPRMTAATGGRRATMGVDSGSWEIVYTQKGQVKNIPVAEAGAGVVDHELAKLPDSAKLLLVLELKYSLLRRKRKGRIHKYTPEHSLSEKHNLFVYLRTNYANGEQIVGEIEQLHSDAVRSEKIRRYGFDQSVDCRWALAKEIKSHLAARPILFAFTAYGSTLWKAQRHFYIPVLVDYENSIQAYELCYDKGHEGHEEIKGLFYRFQVKRVPTWLMLTPERKGGKLHVKISRFEQFRDRYFLAQQSRQQREMKKADEMDVREAFERFVLWGVARVNACRVRLGN